MASSRCDVCALDTVSSVPAGRWPGVWIVSVPRGLRPLPHPRVLVSAQTTRLGGLRVRRVGVGVGGGVGGRKQFTRARTRGGRLQCWREAFAGRGRWR